MMLKVAKNTRWHKIRKVNELIRFVKETFEYDLSAYKDDFVNDVRFEFIVEDVSERGSFIEPITVIRPHYEAVIRTSMYKDMRFDTWNKGNIRFIEGSLSF